MPRRHFFPRHVTSRWFATRGWAFGGALTFGVCAAFFRPADPGVPVWFGASVFGAASVSLLWLSWNPESHYARAAAVFATVLAASGRAWTLLLATAPTLGTRASTALVWLFLAYCCWLLGMFTSSYPSRGG